MKKSITEFIENFKEKKIANTKVAPNAVQEYIAKELEVKKYIPFREKRKIAEMIVDKYTEEVNGIKKYDSISAYVAFVSAMIVAHTSLEIGNDTISEYDLLAESGLLSHIVAEFQESYNECDIILKMAVANELEDNNVNVLVGHFLDNILKRIDGVGNILAEQLGGLDLKSLLGLDIDKEDLANFSSFLDRLK